MESSVNYDLVVQSRGMAETRERLENIQEIAAISLKIDFLDLQTFVLPDALLRKSPSTANFMISYYFEFLRSAEQHLRNIFVSDIQKAKLESKIMEKQVSSMDEDNEGYSEYKQSANELEFEQAKKWAGKVLSKDFRLNLELTNYPNLRLNHRSFSNLQGMLEKNKGCLIHLENLKIIEISEPINYKASSTYKKACDCKNFEKTIRIDLREHLKLNCEKNADKKLTRHPKCFACGASLQEDPFSVSFRHHRIFKVITHEVESVQTETTTRELNLVRKSVNKNLRRGNQPLSQFSLGQGKIHQDMQSVMQVYMDNYELDMHENGCGRSLKIGDTLSGLFYLDSILMYQILGDRIVGDQLLNLISINTSLNIKNQPQPTRLTKDKISKGFDLGINFLKRSSEKQYDYSFFTKDSVNSDEFNCNMIKILSENLETMESSVWMSEPILTLAAYITLFNHMLHHGRLQFKQKDSFVKFDTNLEANTIMNSLVVVEDIRSASQRIVDLTRYYSSVKFLPSYFPNEKSIAYWFTMNSESIIVVPNLLAIKKMAPTLFLTLQHVVCTKTVNLKGQDVALNCSIIMLMSSKEITRDEKMNKVYPDLSLTFQRQFLDSIDLCLNLEHRDWLLRNEKKHNYIYSIEKIGQFMQGKFKQFEAASSSTLGQTFVKKDASYLSPEKKGNAKEQFEGIRHLSNVRGSVFDDEHVASQDSRISNLFKKFMPKSISAEGQGKGVQNQMTKQQVEHLLSTELPKNGFKKGMNLLDNFLRSIKEDKRFTEKHAYSIKKIVLGTRIFRLASCGFFQLLSNFLGSFNRNSFEASQFDSILTILLSDETFSNLYGYRYSSLGQDAGKLLNALSNSVISDKQLADFDEFYISCQKNDIEGLMGDMMKDIFNLLAI